MLSTFHSDGRCKETLSNMKTGFLTLIVPVLHDERRFRTDGRWFVGEEEE